jgi:hypothetical protein
VERGSDLHSPRLDDAQKHEVEGLVRAGRSTHAEEWKDPEPSGEDQPDIDRAPNDTLVGGTPEGMTNADVEGRAELASHLGHTGWPMVREQIIGKLVDDQAPDALVDMVRGLPSGRTFENVNEVWETLGGHVETHRF